MDKITVHIIYAYSSTDFWQKSIFLDKGATVATALKQAEIAQVFPTLDMTQLGIGVFGKKVDIDYVVQADDRIELCRKLTFDPMVSRKRRAEHRKAGILKKKHFKPDHAKKIEVDVHTD